MTHRPVVPLIQTLTRLECNDRHCKPFNKLERLHSKGSDNLLLKFIEYSEYYNLIRNLFCYINTTNTKPFVN